MNPNQTTVEIDGPIAVRRADGSVDIIRITTVWSSRERITADGEQIERKRLTQKELFAFCLKYPGIYEYKKDHDRWVGIHKFLLETKKGETNE